MLDAQLFFWIAAFITWTVGTVVLIRRSSDRVDCIVGLHDKSIVWQGEAGHEKWKIRLVCKKCSKGFTEVACQPKRNFGS